MLTKNKKQESLRPLRALIGCRVLVLALALMVMSGVVSAAKGGNGKGNGNGGGGGSDSGGNDPVCVAFGNLPGDGIQSDGQDPDAPDVGAPYCNNKKAKIEAFIDNGGFLSLTPNTNSHNQPDAGRKLFVDIGRTLVLAGPGIPFQGTSPSLLHPDIVSHNEKLLFRIMDGTDLRAMPVGQTRHDASMRIIISMTYSSGATGSLWLNFDPDFSRFGCTGAGSSATLDVTRVDAATWVLEGDGTDKAALRESYRSTGSPGEEVVIFCHTDPVDNPLGGGEAPFVLPPFTLTVTLAP